jgi:hypothetical protein
MECPYYCSRNFYLKNPDDEHETYEFDFREGKVVFLEKGEVPLSLPLEKDTPIFQIVAPGAGGWKTSRVE